MHQESGKENDLQGKKLPRVISQPIFLSVGKDGGVLGGQLTGAFSADCMVLTGLQRAIPGLKKIHRISQ